MDLNKLTEPFPYEDIEWRLSRCGKNTKGLWGRAVAFIQARAIQERLDEVVGPDRWRVSYRVLPEGVICELSIRCGEEWVTKEDGAEPTEIDRFKGGLSSALKRAGSVWGIGRYLYGLDEGFVEVVTQDTKFCRWGQTKDKEQFFWIPPSLPAWALPKRKEVVNENSGMSTPVGFTTSRDFSSFNEETPF